MAQRIGKYKVSKKENAIYKHDVDTGTFSVLDIDGTANCGGLITAEAGLTVVGTTTLAATTAGGDITFAAGKNIITAGAGTQIGGSGNKIGFFDAAPVVQQAGAGETTGWVSVGGTAVESNDTFTGNIGSTAYTINDVVKALKNLGLMDQ